MKFPLRLLFSFILIFTYFCQAATPLRAYEYTSRNCGPSLDGFDFFEDPSEDDFPWDDDWGDGEIPWPDDDFEDSPEEDEEFGDDPDFFDEPEEDDDVSEELPLPIEEEIPEDLEPNLPDNPTDTDPLEPTNPTSPVLVIEDLPVSMPETLKSSFSKYVNVFGINVLASSGVQDAKVIHAASMMAEYVDNNEDGEPDDALVVQKMLGQKATLLLMTNESENDKIDFDSIERAGFTALQGLYADETLPQGSGPNGFDATIEEVLHLVSSSGIAKAYPDIFGENPGTALANAMDKARGGRFMSPPSTYPTESWYHYDDYTCDYSCMVTEYFYWALTSILGAQSYPGRAEEIANEWEAPTRNLVQSKDPDVFALLTNPVYKLPSVLPDGVYSPIISDEPPLEDIPPVDEAPIDEDPAPPVDDPDNGEIPDDNPIELPDDGETPEEDSPEEGEEPEEDEDNRDEDTPDEGEIPEEDEELERDEPKFFIQPVGEPITIGPLAGAVQFVEGWFYSSWFGVFRIDEGPDPSWVYHVQLGWIYVSGNGSENLWLWSENPELGWLWTHREFLSLKENAMGWKGASLYREADTSWLYYLPDEDQEKNKHNGNLFYNYTTGLWQSTE